MLEPHLVLGPTSGCGGRGLGCGGGGPGAREGRYGLSHQAVLPPGPGSDLTSKQIGGVPDARSQMGTQRVREVRASRTRRSRASVFLCQSGLDERTGELGARGFLELGQVMLLNRLDLNNVHWANICPRHQRSRRSLCPSLQVPADEVGPSGQGRGLQERGRLLPQETLVPRRGAPKEAQGAGTGGSSPLGHLSQVTQPQTARRPLPGPPR